jgi:hypothetical protein
MVHREVHISPRKASISITAQKTRFSFCPLFNTMSQYADIFVELGVEVYSYVLDKDNVLCVLYKPSFFVTCVAIRDS